MDRFLSVIHENWTLIDNPLTLPAYALWRMNWIHPFVEGNGRTARAACYYLIRLKQGRLLPGSRMVPERIPENREPYYAALRAADEAWEAGHFDVNQPSAYLDGLLKGQLTEAAVILPAEIPAWIGYRVTRYPELGIVLPDIPNRTGGPMEPITTDISKSTQFKSSILWGTGILGLMQMYYLILEFHRHRSAMPEQSTGLMVTYLACYPMAWICLLKKKPNPFVIVAVSYCLCGVANLLIFPLAR